MAKTLACVVSSVLWLSTVVYGAASQAERAPQAQAHNAVAKWLDHQEPTSVAHMTANFLANGAVLASPSKTDPDYYYHWTRDAALTMATVSRIYATASDPAERSRLGDMMRNYALFVRGINDRPTQSGPVDAYYTNIGEPKYNVDGTPYDRPWGRPQTDGPALGAITLLKFLSISAAEDQQSFVGRDDVPVIKEVITQYLDYTAHHWQTPSFDLWEEVRGHHFYNVMAQRRALLLGAQYMHKNGDKARAAHYKAQAQVLTARAEKYWDEKRGYIVATHDRSGGIDYKYSNLDVAAVLAVLHTDDHGEFFGPTDDRVLLTALRLVQSFHQLFPINQRHIDHDGLAMAPGIGRYPEDRYDGVTTSTLGHGWFIATAALAELHYRAALGFATAGRIEINNLNRAFFASLPGSALNSVLTEQAQSGKTVVLKKSQDTFKAVITAMLDAGDQYIARVRHHAGSSGALDEQFDRFTGFMRGARRLTWSYASVLSATDQRRQLIELLKD
ncbi:MAG: hypothetical protein FJ146_16055 [Deltaproteobacteria bacterium]|nr:hypothetical protein [Deltaproteobacteria bacterium]